MVELILKFISQLNNPSGNIVQVDDKILLYIPKEKKWRVMEIEDFAVDYETKNLAEQTFIFDDMEFKGLIKAIRGLI